MTKKFLRSLSTIIIVGTMTLSACSSEEKPLDNAVGGALTLTDWNEYEEFLSLLSESCSDIKLDTIPYSGANRTSYGWTQMQAGDMVESKSFSSEDEVIEYIGELDQILETESFSARIMMLDSRGSCCDANGQYGVWEDIDRISSGADRYTFITDSYIYKGSYWTFVQKLHGTVRTADGSDEFTHIILLKDVNTFSEYYSSNAYGGENETYILILILD